MYTIYVYIVCRCIYLYIWVFPGPKEVGSQSQVCPRTHGYDGVISQSQRSAMFNKVTAAFHKMVPPWPKMMAKPKWQPPVYIGEGPSGSDVLPAKLVVGLCSCQPITTDHVTGKGEWLPQQMPPEAAGRGTGLLLEAEDGVSVTSYLIQSW